MSNLILSYILLYSSMYSVDPLLVRAVIEVESRGNIHQTGAAGEIGLMQLLPESFPHLNHKKLENPKLNIQMGVKYLAEMKKYCPHQEDMTWLVCYNAGVGGASKFKFPKKFVYYKKVMKEYERLKHETEDFSVQARE